MLSDAVGSSAQFRVDYNLPERFGLNIQAATTRNIAPVMIHRAPFGSMERFVACFLSTRQANFPLWLIPEQAVVLPISEKFNDYARKVVEMLDEEGVRAFVDDRNEKIEKKIRDNELKKVPHLLIVGEKEAQNDEISVRKQGEGDKGSMKIVNFAAELNAEIASMIK